MRKDKTKRVPMKAVIVLAMHGVPPNNFPERETAELFSLRARVKKAAGTERAALERRLLELDAKMRVWPRTAQNDHFYAASQQLRTHLSEATGSEVIVAFNEFCAPSLSDALNQAIARGAKKVIVVTPMMTRGGEHAEVDIPAAIKIAQAKHPEIPIVYAWPFKVSEVANFLAEHIAGFS
jgi:sirohydrochlorin cobaltochelatase